jgi:hypothetical protein
MAGKAIDQIKLLEHGQRKGTKKGRTSPHQQWSILLPV